MTSFINPLAPAHFKREERLRFQQPVDFNLGNCPDQLSLNSFELPPLEPPKRALTSSLQTLDKPQLEAAFEVQVEDLRRRTASLETCEAFLWCKKIYEFINPETKHGGVRNSGTKASSKLEKLLLKTGATVQSRGESRSYVACVARRIKVSEAQIYRALEIATKIDSEVKNKIRDTRVATDFADLYRLAKLSVADQRQVTEGIDPEDERTIAAARTKLRAASSKSRDTRNGCRASEQEMPAVDLHNQLVTKFLQAASDLEAVGEGVWVGELRRIQTYIDAPSARSLRLVCLRVAAILNKSGAVKTNGSEGKFFAPSLLPPAEN